MSSNVNNVHKENTAPTGFQPYQQNGRSGAPFHSTLLAVGQRSIQQSSSTFERTQLPRHAASNNLLSSFETRTDSPINPPSAFTNMREQKQTPPPTIDENGSTCPDSAGSQNTVSSNGSLGLDLDRIRFPSSMPFLRPTSTLFETSYSEASSQSLSLEQSEASRKSGFVSIDLEDEREAPSNLTEQNLQNHNTDIDLQRPETRRGGNRLPKTFESFQERLHAPGGVSLFDNNGRRPKTISTSPEHVPTEPTEVPVIPAENKRASAGTPDSFKEEGDDSRVNKRAKQEAPLVIKVPDFESDETQERSKRHKPE